MSIPCPLKDAGGRRVPGERGSVPDADVCGEKYDGEVVVVVVDDAEACVVSDGVEGLVVRREREDGSSSELLEGKRRSDGGSGPLVTRERNRLCWLEEGCGCCAAEGFRECEAAGIASKVCAGWRICRANPVSSSSKTKGQQT